MKCLPSKVTKEPEPTGRTPPGRDSSGKSSATECFEMKLAASVSGNSLLVMIVHLHASLPQLWSRQPWGRLLPRFEIDWTGVLQRLARRYACCAFSCGSPPRAHANQQPDIAYIWEQPPKRPLIRPARAGENARRGPPSPPRRRETQFLSACARNRFSLSAGERGGQVSPKGAI